MINEDVVHRIRLFNRIYLPSMNLLGNHYLGSEYSVTEARVFFEIYENEGCNAAYIAKGMNIDKSYLSRIIKAHERNGYIVRKPSENDGRSLRLYLTEKGKKRAEHFIRTSDEEIGGIIDWLSSDEQKSFSEAVECLLSLLNKIEARRSEQPK